MGTIHAMAAHRLLASCVLTLICVLASDVAWADEQHPFAVDGAGWRLVAGAGALPDAGRSGEASGYVQVTTSRGSLTASSARFDPVEGWVELVEAEGRWQDVTVRGARIHLSGSVLDVTDGRLSPCHDLELPEYSLYAERFQLVDYRNYLFLHADQLDLALFGQKLIRLPRLDIVLDALIDRFRVRTTLADQGWFTPNVLLGSGVTFSGHYRFLNRPGAKGYLQTHYSTLRQFSTDAGVELTDGAQNLLLGMGGWQFPAPVARTGPWGMVRGVHRFTPTERIEAIVSGRELLGGQTISRTPEVAWTTDWRGLGPLDWRYDLRLGQFLIEDLRSVTRFGGQLELALRPISLWEGAQLQPMIEGVGRSYLQDGPLLGTAAQLQLTQSFETVQLMARVRSRWAFGANPLRYENYVTDQVVGGMVAWQLLPPLKVGLFGEWSVSRSTPVAMDLLASYVSDCLALHFYYNVLYSSSAFRWNLLAF